MLSRERGGERKRDDVYMLDAPLYRALAVLLEVEVLQVAGLRLTGRRDKAANC